MSRSHFVRFVLRAGKGDRLAGSASAPVSASTPASAPAPAAIASSIDCLESCLGTAEGTPMCLKTATTALPWHPYVLAMAGAWSLEPPLPAVLGGSSARQAAPASSGEARRGTLGASRRPPHASKPGRGAHKLLQASATRSEAALPVSLVQEAFELRGRMLKVLDYYLDGDDAGLARLAAIRSGSGHLDLADDLTALADLYKEHKAALVADTKNYRKIDEKLARETAARIVKLLGTVTTSDERRWKDAQARAFTLLVRNYEEALRVGRFLFHRDGGDRLFPSLYSAVRSAPSPSATKSDGDAPTSEDASSDGDAPTSEDASPAP